MGEEKDLSNKLNILYIFINNQMESISSCWEYIMLQWSGSIVSVNHMARL